MKVEKSQLDIIEEKIDFIIEFLSYLMDREIERLAIIAKLGELISAK